MKISTRSGWKGYQKELTEVGQDLKSLINTDKVMGENDKLLDEIRI